MALPPDPLEDALPVAAHIVVGLHQKLRAPAEVMVAWSRMPSRELPFANTGLVSDHAYAVFGVEEKDGERRVLLRNPWGESPWSARGGRGVQERSRGVVSMTVEDFRRYFIGLGAVAPPLK